MYAIRIASVNLVAAPVVRAPVALLHETELLVELDRARVVREHVQLELLHVGLASPFDGRLQQCGADALAAVRGGDHDPEVRDMAARGMLVARDRETADDQVPVSCDEDRGVRVAADCAQVTALVRNVAPAVRRDEPALRFGADGLAELGEPLRVVRSCSTDDHSTTTPAPPRRGSPAAASSPSLDVTAEAPPK